MARGARGSRYAVTSRVNRTYAAPHTSYPVMLALITALTVAALAKSVLLTLLAVLNAVLALLATVSVWKTYLVIGTKIFLTLLICIPVVGLLIYLVWGQKKVREARLG